MTDWWQQPAHPIDTQAQEVARQRQALLTKPPGSLGRLEVLAQEMAGFQGRAEPLLDNIKVVVFAADHGVVEEGVSASPQSVTVEMIRNFCAGGAAISVLAREIGADMEVVDVGACEDPGPLTGLLSQRVAPGTANLAEAPAMTQEQCRAALEVGRVAAERAQLTGMQLFIGGEMGIGNTTSATALAAASLGLGPAELLGGGAAAGGKLARKVEVVERALALHAGAAGSLERLAALGGLEIAALVGAYVHCPQRGLPVLVDGYVASVAALLAMQLNPGIRPWLLFSHRSADPGHDKVLQSLEVAPLLDLGLRIGEGSGAAAAVPILRAALALHDRMSTFAEAGVSRSRIA